MKILENIVVSMDFSDNEDVTTLIVSRRKGEKVEIVNLIRGQEATELYAKLTSRNGEKSWIQKDIPT